MILEMIIKRTNPGQSAKRKKIPWKLMNLKQKLSKNWKNNNSHFSKCQQVICYTLWSNSYIWIVPLADKYLEMLHLFSWGRGQSAKYSYSLSQNIFPATKRITGLFVINTQKSPSSTQEIWDPVRKATLLHGKWVLFPHGISGIL